MTETSKPGWLFVSNIPTSCCVTETDISQFFDGALLAVRSKLHGLSFSNIQTDKLPVLSVERFSEPDGTCFICLRDCEDNLPSLQLSNIPFLGRNLTVTLPQCLPREDFQSLPYPTFPSHLLPSPFPSYQSWKLRHIVFSEFPKTATEEEIRNFFAPNEIESIFCLKDNDKEFLGCGNILLKAPPAEITAIAEKLDGTRFNETCMIKISVLLPYCSNQPVTPTPIAKLPQAVSEAPSGMDIPSSSSVPTALPTSMSFQLMRKDPLIAMQVCAGKQIGSKPSRVVQLLNVVTVQELLVDAIYEEIAEDVYVEACKYGKLENVMILRPKKTDNKIELGSGVGKVFLHYGDLTSARRAKHEFNGRSFAQRTVCAAFYPEDAFLRGEYSQMAP